MKNRQRFVVYALRHDPDALGVRLDSEGWCDVPPLLKALHASMCDLREIVRLSGGRLTFDAGENRIRAAHGHSVRVELGGGDTPPDVLYHGTATRNVAGISKEGLLPMGRAYVHLSESRADALRVAKRHSPDVTVLTIDAKAMYADGVAFHRSEDGVWLVGRVDPRYVMEANR